MEDSPSPVSQHASLYPGDPILSSPDQPKNSSKTPVIRGARACTTCRQAKMKCVGADEGGPCQRCKRSGVECVFEKHRRGRKPGSKLSEASKMLRRLEKGLNSAKLKSQSISDSTTISSLPLSSSPFPPDSRSPTDRYGNHDLPPLNIPNDYDTRMANRSQLLTSINGADDEDDPDRVGEGMFPAQLIRKESERNSFFKTILNPENHEPIRSSSERSFPQTSPPPGGGNPANSPSPTPPSASDANGSPTGPNSGHPTSYPVVPGLKDPVDAGMISLDTVTVFWDAFFLRLNPFINLFDPQLHTHTYVRSKCPFLFTTILMACCKFFEASSYKPLRKLADEYAVRAFMEQWKRVEVVQAFACLTYWKEPEDTRTWTYIGYACRMAIELGLNKYVSPMQQQQALARRPPSLAPSPEETMLQKRERRNRERTYLVLFVHDRSLSTQTGRQWMLSVDDIVKHSTTWHEEGVLAHGLRRPEDVIVSSFVQLRLIASETSDIFYSQRSGNAMNTSGLGMGSPNLLGSPQSENGKESNASLLRSSDEKLVQWMDHWKSEMHKSETHQDFHIAFIRFFWLYVRVFLNSFGVQSALSTSKRVSPNIDALNVCYTSALEHLSSVNKEFAKLNLLQYGQETITVMTAYCAVFLLKLLRNPNTLTHLPQNAKEEIYKHISEVAAAYNNLKLSSIASGVAAHHARFLQSLIHNDQMRVKQAEQLAKRQELAAAAEDTKYTQGSASGSGQGSGSLSGGFPPLNGMGGPSSSSAHAASGTHAQESAMYSMGGMSIAPVSTDPSGATSYQHFPGSSSSTSPTSATTATSPYANMPSHHAAHLNGGVQHQQQHQQHQQQHIPKFEYPSPEQHPLLRTHHPHQQQQAMNGYTNGYGTYGMDISPPTESDVHYMQYSHAIFREIGHHGGMEGIYPYYPPLNEMDATNMASFQGGFSGGDPSAAYTQGNYGVYQSFT